MTDLAEAQALWAAATDCIWADERIVASILSQTVVALRCEAAWESSSILRIYYVAVSWGAWARNIERDADIEAACEFLRGGR